MAERRCVVVAGFPRSGTSWLAKCLSFAPGFTHYREPDNFQTLSIGSKNSSGSGSATFPSSPPDEFES